MYKHPSRVTETEQRVRQTEDMVTEHPSALCTLQSKLKALEHKVDDAENHNRRNNLCIVGLVEGVEGTHPTVFVEDMLRSLLPNAHFSPYYTIERAHHIPPKPGPLGPPRAHLS